MRLPVSKAVAFLGILGTQARTSLDEQEEMNRNSLVGTFRGVPRGSTPHEAVTRIFRCKYTVRLSYHSTVTSLSRSTAHSAHFCTHQHIRSSVLRIG